jgi:lysophospholipase L1-like esterase
MLVLSTLFSSFAFAAPAKDPSLRVVALGDSITTGYPTPSDTFPNFINGSGDVVKIAEIGATSQSLLAKIKSDANFGATIQNADVITLNIGSNDFLADTNLGAFLTELAELIGALEVLQTAELPEYELEALESSQAELEEMMEIAAALEAGELPLADLETAENLDALLVELENTISMLMAMGLLEEDVQLPALHSLTDNELIGYQAVLSEIIRLIKAETDAPIILYNLYNPINVNALGEGFGLALNPLHSFVEGELSKVNHVINNLPGVYRADAYNAFKGNEGVYTLPLDIHPTVAGHEALAGLADDILKQILIPEISLTQTPVEPTTGPVEVTVETNKNIVELKWLPGEKEAGDFESAGTSIENNQFSVNENGVYTVFAVNIVGNTAVESIEIGNITPPVVEEPDEDRDGEDPQPPETEDPNEDQDQEPTTGEEETNNEKEPTTIEVVEDTVESTGNNLPNTATPLYNYLAAGLVLVLVGIVALKVQRNRRNRNQIS